MPTLSKQSAAAAAGVRSADPLERRAGCESQDESAQAWDSPNPTHDGEAARNRPPTGSGIRSHAGRAVLVHAGARDAYQMAVALEEADLLETLVTDLFWADERGWRSLLTRVLPPGLRARLRQRSVSGLSAGRVATETVAGLGGLLLDRVHALPFALRRSLTRAADARLGRQAGLEARRRGAGLVSYSYYAYDAFTAYGRAGMLFQLHPHPETMRRILREELERWPECAPSLLTEWEMCLPEEDFAHLVREPQMASRYLVASSFTRQSLIDHGAAPDAITVVPYGVDLARFRPDPRKAETRTGRLRLLFVGRINQRKGVRYLLEALRLLAESSAGTGVELTICGRAVDDLKLFEPFRSQLEIRTSVSGEELVRAYQTADLFVFPSVGEGFGQVLLEALACGLPILTTTHTAGPDLIEDGVEGFIVAPRRPDLLAERIAWAVCHRDELASMGQRARERAEHFTWERFRQAAAAAVRDYLAATDPAAATGRHGGAPGKEAPACS